MSKIWSFINRGIACKVFLVTTLLSGCAAQKLSAPPAEGLLLDPAGVNAVDDLFLQTQRLPGLLARISKKRLLVDHLNDAASGQQTKVMQVIEQKIDERVHSEYSQWEIVPFRPSNVSQAQYLMAGTLTHEEKDARRHLRLNLSLTELRTGLIVAHTSVLIIDQGLDVNPTQYYRDSPVMVRDGATDAYARTAATQSGQKADPVYIERVVTASLISEA